MSKVISISRSFLSHCKKRGEPTHFVEKIYESLCPNGWDEHFDKFIRTLNSGKPEEMLEEFRASLSNEKGFRPDPKPDPTPKKKQKPLQRKKPLWKKRVSFSKQAESKEKKLSPPSSRQRSLEISPMRTFHFEKESRYPMGRR